MTVTLECGVEDELSNVSEPSKCTYASILKTPAACDAKHAQELRLELGGEPMLHDEL